MALPGFVHRRAGRRFLARDGAVLPAHLRARLGYYYRVPGPFELGDDADDLPLERLGRQRNYWFDLAEHLRRLPSGLRLHYRFGDSTVPPERPTIVKARCIGETSGTSVLLKLNQVRHYVFVRDRRPFASKLDSVVWRGGARQPHRRQFVERWFGHRQGDIGRTDSLPGGEEFRRPYMGIDAQLAHKFVLSIEGNDVATNLKWILSSNSLCLMPRPTKETWFMEGRLEPGVHYVELRDDLEDLADAVARWSRDTCGAERIIQNANAWTRQFQDRRDEDTLALLVLQRYFADSGQISLADVDGSR